MEVLYMLISSLLPAVLLIGYVRYRDRRRPEPMMRIIQAVIYGLFSAFLAVPLAMALEGLVYSSGYGIFAVLPFVRGVFSAFVGAAIPEESMKLLMLWLMLRNCDDFDEAMDGIVYAVCIGMGFAGLENVLYVFQSEDGWATTALMRSLLAGTLYLRRADGLLLFARALLSAPLPQISLLHLAGTSACPRHLRCHTHGGCRARTALDAQLHTARDFLRVDAPLLPQAFCPRRAPR